MSGIEAEGNRRIKINWTITVCASRLSPNLHSSGLLEMVKDRGSDRDGVNLDILRTLDARND